MDNQARSGWRYAGEHLLAFALTTVLLAWLYGLPGRDLAAPLTYRGDALDSVLYARLILDHGWPLEHPEMGAPHGLALHDYQRSATVQFALMWAVGQFVDDPVQLTNLYFYLTFPLTTAVALAVLRRLGLGFGPALLGAVLFAFLPYHQHRGIDHLFLAGYFLVPAGVLLAVWVSADEPQLMRPAGDETRRGLSRRGMVAGLLAVLVGSTEVYYAVFTCLFLAAGGLVAVYRRRSARGLLPAAALIALIGLTAAVNLGPQFAYRWHHGGNPDAGRRSPWDAQHFDLRIVQMLLPTSDHRLPAVARMKEAVNRQLLRVTENDAASLGLLPSIGFLYLLLCGLFRSRDGSAAEPPLSTVARFNLTAVVVGTMGGFGMMTAFAFPYIRCYNRLSVFIAFFSLIALAHLVDRLLAGRSAGGVGRLAAAALVIVLACGGAWDQTPAAAGRVDEGGARMRAADQAFVHRVEAVLPAGALVFQAPHVLYPEGQSYDHLRLSLHATHTRWSFPTMRGRPAELWQRAAWQLPPDASLDRLAWAGFAAVCWDRHVSDSDDRERERQVRRRLGPPTVTSPDDRFALYPLTDHAARLRAAVGAAEAERRRQEALYPVLVRWDRGFQQTPEAGDRHDRWGNASSELHLFNLADEPRRTAFALEVRSGPAGGGRLAVRGPGLDETFEIGPAAQTVRLAIAVPPGRSVVRFRCTAPCHPEHARRYFQVVTFRQTPADDAPAVAIRP